MAEPYESEPDMPYESEPDLPDAGQPYDHHAETVKAVHKALDILKNTSLAVPEMNQRDRQKRDIFAEDTSEPKTEGARIGQTAAELAKSLGSTAVLGLNGASFGLLPKAAGAVAGAELPWWMGGPGDTTGGFDKGAYKDTRDAVQDVVDSARKRKGVFAGANEFLGGAVAGNVVPGSGLVKGGLAGAGMGGAAAYGYSKNDPLAGEGNAEDLAKDVGKGVVVGGLTGAGLGYLRGKADVAGKRVLSDATNKAERELVEAGGPMLQHMGPEAPKPSNLTEEHLRALNDYVTSNPEPGVTEDMLMGQSFNSDPDIKNVAGNIAKNRTGLVGAAKDAVKAPFTLATKGEVGPGLERTVYRGASGLVGSLQGMEPRAYAKYLEEGKDVPDGPGEQGTRDYDQNLQPGLVALMSRKRKR